MKAIATTLRMSKDKVVVRKRIDRVEIGLTVVVIRKLSHRCLQDTLLGEELVDQSLHVGPKRCGFMLRIESGYQAGPSTCTMPSSTFTA